MCRLLGYCAREEVPVAHLMGADGFAEFTGLAALHCDGWGKGWYEGSEPRLRKAPESAEQAPEYAKLAQSLREIGVSSALGLFSMYAGRAADLRGWLRDAAINRDRDLRLEYLAGLSMNQFRSDRIYAEMLQYRRFPSDVFIGSDATTQLLRAAVEHAPGGEL